MNELRFDPIDASRTIEESYREYIASTVHFDDAGLQEQLESILRKRNYLAKGPLLEATPPYRKSKSLRKMVEEGVLCKGMLRLGNFDVDRLLYEHQVEAIEKASEGKNYVVVTGTGSGKTESFLLPIINDIMAEFASKGQQEPGVRAMILYPMNALANDQLKRIRELLSDSDITFGRYTGDTRETFDKAKEEWSIENPGKKLGENELISREDMRNTPPNIMLTNYSMLEYLLLRPQDATLFSGAFGKNWRHLAIDEAHVYTGTLGTEISFLIRRLKARIQIDSGAKLELHCYATSATIGDEKDIPKVAQFAEDLFGEPFEKGPSVPSVITSTQDPSINDLRTPCWGSLPLSAWSQLRPLLAEDVEETAVNVRALLKPIIPSAELEFFDTAPNVRVGLGTVLLGESTTNRVVSRLAEGLLDLTDIGGIQDLEIDGLLPDESGIENLTSIVEVLSGAWRAEDIPVLASRYHSFLRAPEGMYINLREKRLIEKKTTSVSYGESHEMPIYEVSVCRHCGQAYILGSHEIQEGIQWLNPIHVGTEADGDFSPREYFRLAKTGDGDIDEDNSTWLCPICGSLHSSETDGKHRFEHEAISRVLLVRGNATEDEAQCGHCGYKNRYAIQPMRVSPEAAGSVVCSDLARSIPPFKQNNKEIEKNDNMFAGMGEQLEGKSPGSVICFSDRRQDAAFFAPAMDRTYTRITYRQMLVEAVKTLCRGGKTCSPSDAVIWLKSVGLIKYKPNRDDVVSSTSKERLAWAIVLDELMAEDTRQSTEGLGVIRYEATTFISYMEDAQYEGAINSVISALKKNDISWIEPSQFKTIALVLLENLRQSGTVDVPEMVSEYRLNRKKKLTMFFEGTEESGSNSTVAFVGLAKGAENGRSKFVRKFASESCGIELSREDAQVILQQMFGYITQLLQKIGSDKGIDYLKQDLGGRYYLNPNIWTLRPHGATDVSYRCGTCGVERQYDTQGVCPTHNCMGRMSQVTFSEGMSKDAYYKNLYQEEAMPLRIEEHTAQLSTERAREIQKDFIDGKVHILSCTTTFELGVDVGDLRAVFLRNVPPSTANYKQRAGRTGRRAGMPGYAITFARLRPHDIAFFRKPQEIIQGKMNPPHCYMDNDTVAIRHVFAIALSQYFRDTFNRDTCDYAKQYNDFLEIDQGSPAGLEALTRYLKKRNTTIQEQVKLVFEGNDDLARVIGVDDWNWVDDLVSPTKGRLSKTHELKNSDYMRLRSGVEENRESHLYLAQGLERSIMSLKEEQTISVLAEGGILPKYGFPTDLVSLNLIDQDTSTKTNSLQLQRGLRQAITEYAPGAEIVAAKQLWKSVGIHKLRGREWEIRYYAECPSCGNFIWAIENGKHDMECPCCHQTVILNKKMLVPSFGFDGQKVSSKSVGQKRPRTSGYSKVFFSQQWPDEVQDNELSLSGGSVALRYANNARLCVLNNGGANSGYNVCSYCGAAAPIATSSVNFPHRSFCKEKYAKHYDSIGTSFNTDVLELSFSLASFHAEDADWESAMWALIAASNELLETPSSELGGTMFHTSSTMSLMLYDDVPGGAGHVLQLSQQMGVLLEKAFIVVDSCTCNAETCCYGCLCNYRNQSVQNKLSRGGAAKILGALLGKDGYEGNVQSPHIAAPKHDEDDDKSKDGAVLRVKLDLSGPDMSAMSFSSIIEIAANRCADESDKLFLGSLSTLSVDMHFELPSLDVVFFDDDEAEAEALLVWKQAGVVYLSVQNQKEFIDEFGDFVSIEGWIVATAERTTPGELASQIEENR